MDLLDISVLDKLVAKRRQLLVKPGTKGTSAQPKLLRSTVCSNTVLSDWRDCWKLGYL